MWQGISIHAAREGGDVLCFVAMRIASSFQSTPPVKAATGSGTSPHANPAISIHAAREGGDSYLLFGVFNWVISIHAAREGGDHISEDFKRVIKVFQSTPPVKAATAAAGHRFAATDFNPRRP